MTNARFAHPSPSFHLRRVRLCAYPQQLEAVAEDGDDEDEDAEEEVEQRPARKSAEPAKLPSAPAPSVASANSRAADWWLRHEARVCRHCSDAKTVKRLSGLGRAMQQDAQEQIIAACTSELREHLKKTGGEGETMRVRTWLRARVERSPKLRRNDEAALAKERAELETRQQRQRAMIAQKVVQLKRKAGAQAGGDDDADGIVTLDDIGASQPVGG